MQPVARALVQAAVPVGARVVGAAARAAEAAVEEVAAAEEVAAEAEVAASNCASNPARPRTCACLDQFTLRWLVTGDRFSRPDPHDHGRPARA